MYKHVFVFLVVVSSGVQAVPLNRFVNKTIDARPDLVIVEGDIVRDRLNATSEGLGRNAYLGAAKWTGGLLPYVIDGASQYTAAHIQTITNSMRKIEQQTNNCIRFVQRTNQPTWLRIYSGSGCWSYLGRAKTSGSQDLSIDRSGCVWQATIIHEFLHAVGFDHEQNRPDRDKFVSILWGNIQSDAVGEFEAYPASQVNTFNRAYDYSSVMHYEWNAWSKNGQPTILPRQAGIDRNTLGSATQMTNLDIQKVKAYYGCP